MSDIRMSDGSIKFDGDWLTADDLQRKIKAKMDSGDMRFADMAAALQELNEALDKAYTLEVKIVLSKAEYDRLKAIGGEDDNASVRKAIRAFVGGVKPKAEVKAATPADAAAEKPAAEVKAFPSPDAAAEKAAADVKDAAPLAEKPTETGDTITCTKCKTPIPIPTSARPLELECEFCGTSIHLPVEAIPAETTPPAGAVPPAETVLPPDAAPSAEAEEKTPAPEKSGEPKRTDHFIG